MSRGGWDGRTAHSIPSPFPFAPSYYRKEKWSPNLPDKRQARLGFANRSMRVIARHSAVECYLIVSSHCTTHRSLVQRFPWRSKSTSLRFTICAKSTAIRSRSCRACESASICLWPRVVMVAALLRSCVKSKTSNTSTPTVTSSSAKVNAAYSTALQASQGVPSVVCAVLSAFFAGVTGWEHVKF